VHLIIADLGAGGRALFSLLVLPRPGTPGTLLQRRPHVNRSWTLRTLFQFKLDGIALAQAIKIIFDSEAAPVKENFFSVSGPDKTEPSVAHELFYCALHMDLNLREGGASWHVEDGAGRRTNLSCALGSLAPLLPAYGDFGSIHLPQNSPFLKLSRHMRSFQISIPPSAFSRISVAVGNSRLVPSARFTKQRTSSSRRDFIIASQPDTS
jgi:hypothetical protein